MAHQHPVVDSDIRFAINPITRAITRVEAKKSSLVVGDHNSERFTFEIPKIVEGHDMTLCNVVRVHYLNTSSDNKSLQSLGVYEVDDFAIDSDDENLMKFTWLISRKATQYVGPLSFTIQFACMTGFKVDYSWQSGIFSGITVANSVNGAEVVIEEYADILRQWWEQLYASSDLPITVMPVEDFEALNGNTRNGMLYILSDDPAVEDLEKIPSIEQHLTTLDTTFANLEEKVEDELTPAIQANTKKIEDIQGVQTTLNTKLVNVEEKIEDEVDPAIQEIPAIKNNITILNTRLVNVEENVEELGASVDSLEKNVDDNATELVSTREAAASIGSKWQWGEYTKLYEYDTVTGIAVTTKVTTGLYMIRAERKSGEYTLSASIILDTLHRNFSTTSFAFPDILGDVKYYTIRPTEINSFGVVTFVPYEIVPDITVDDDGYHSISWQESPNTNPALDITLYGRCIYTNPVLVHMVDTLPFIVTPITELSGKGVLHYLRVTGTSRVESSSGSAVSDFEGILYLDSASPAEFTVAGTSIKSNKGVIETSLGDIEITGDISAYGENAAVSVNNSTFTLYCGNAEYPIS